jgi:hypothetical protein
MQVFRHGRLQELVRLLARSNAVFTKFNASDLDLPQDLVNFLDDAITSCHRLSLAIGENALLAMKAQFVSAQQGINPMTLERATSHRRALERAIALSVLQRSGQQLRADIAADDETLAAVRTLLVPIALHALHKRLAPESPLSQTELESLWKALMQDSDLQSAARQVAMMAHQSDILILLGDLLGAVRQ